MIASRLPLTDQDLNVMCSNRIGIMRSEPDVHFDSRDVRTPIQYTTPLNLRSGNTISDLYFTDCVFYQPVELGNYQTIGNVFFRHCTFLADVNFNGYSNIKIGEECVFQKNLSIQNDGSACSITECAIDGTLRLSGFGIKLSMKRINSAASGQRLRLEAIFPEIEINECYFDKCFLNLVRRDKQEVKINGGEFKEVHISCSSSDSMVELRETRVKKIILGSANSDRIRLAVRYCKGIMEFKVPLNKIREGTVAYSEINQLQLYEAFDQTGIFMMEYCTITKLHFTRLFNEGYISLRNVTVPKDGILGLSSANIGKTEFINCDFSEATLEYENARIMDIFLAQTDFPKEVKLNYELSHAQAQLVFGQLRTVFDKQGDLARALEYQAREIEAHYHNIGSFWRKRPPFLHFTKLNLGLNRLSNNFGRDWGRGVVFSLATGVLCFTALVWTTHEYTLHGHWQFDPRLIASFARFMNPLRFFDLETLFTQNSKQPYVTLTWGSYVLDFLGRVVIAYGYYQTIQAFRRYGRK